MNTPKQRGITTEALSYVSPISTSDTPIYDGLAHAIYGDQDGPLVDRQSSKGTSIEQPSMWTANEPTNVILDKVLAALNRNGGGR